MYNIYDKSNVLELVEKLKITAWGRRGGDIFQQHGNVQHNYYASCTAYEAWTQTCVLA